MVLEKGSQEKEGYSGKIEVGLVHENNHFLIILILISTCYKDRVTHKVNIGSYGSAPGYRATIQCLGYTKLRSCLKEQKYNNNNHAPCSMLVLLALPLNSLASEFLRLPHRNYWNLKHFQTFHTKTRLHCM